MPNPEVKFTLVARYETQPGEGGYASANTPQECLDLDRSMLEDGHISVEEFINFCGEFAELEWTFELVDSSPPSDVGDVIEHTHHEWDAIRRVQAARDPETSARLKFETPRGH